MTKGKVDYPYPEDEFDVPADPDGPHGVHRAPRTARSRWMPFIVVLIVVPIVTFAAVYLVTQGDSVRDLLGMGSDSQAKDENADTNAESEAGTEETDETGSETAPSEAAPAPTPVLTTPVVVLNAAGVKGLAADGQTALTSAGFTAVTVDNTDKGALTESTIYYGSADLEPTAQLVASTLGLTAVQLDASVSGVRVVLIEKLPA